MNQEVKTQGVNIIDIPWVTDADVYHESQKACVRVLHGESWEEALLDLVSQWEQEDIERGNLS